jgi:hypothetical protein
MRNAPISRVAKSVSLKGSNARQQFTPYPEPRRQASSAVRSLRTTHAARIVKGVLGTTCNVDVCFEE